MGMKGKINSWWLSQLTAIPLGQQHQPGSFFSMARLVPAPNWDLDSAALHAGHLTSATDEEASES